MGARFFHEFEPAPKRRQLEGRGRLAGWLVERGTSALLGATMTGAVGWLEGRGRLAGGWLVGWFVVGWRLVGWFVVGPKKRPAPKQREVSPHTHLESGISASQAVSNIFGCGWGPTPIGRGW